MLFSIAAFLLPLGAAAAHERSFSSRHGARTTGNATLERRTTYTLEDMYQGASILSEFDFNTFDDPTHGLVTYLSQADAEAKGLAYVQKDGTTVLAVDDTTTLAAGAKRNSVRITSKKTYNDGLFIFDAFAMPHGPSVWPAWWTVGPNWPAGGEIDILEGVNTATSNQLTLHTSTGCTLTTATSVKADIGNKQCATINGDNTGCGFTDTDDSSYGHGFNMAAGGVYAHLWDSTGIKVWHFARSAIPKDITAKDPNPSSWGEPVASWAATSCGMSEHFYDHQLVIDTTLCGDWAGAAFDGGASACAAAVADPSNFKLAKWMLNYIAVYKS
jgi:hypothetical protein